jgi:lipopolysaccharide/colanic/teichoic acid biosynthesis glycosyltransferase
MYEIINSKNIRIYDFILSLTLIIFLSPLIIFLFVICLSESPKPIFIQKRVGKNKVPFNLYKFRTMKLNSPSVASHLVSQNQVTPFGTIIRLLKLDELLQLVNVLKGDMSLIGPRPCLFNQKELISEREKYNLFSVKPGISGLAQIKGIDMSKPSLLVKTEYKMISRFSQIRYFKYLFLTFTGRGQGDRVQK